MGQGPPGIATGAIRHGSTAEKEKDNDEAPLLLWQRHARQPSPASDLSKQENASRAVGSESALLPMVGLSLPLTCTGHRGSARSVSGGRGSCAKEDCGVGGGVMPRFDYDCGIDFFYPWPRIAGN